MGIESLERDCSECGPRTPGLGADDPRFHGHRIRGVSAEELIRAGRGLIPARRRSSETGFSSDLFVDKRVSLQGHTKAIAYAHPGLSGGRHVRACKAYSPVPNPDVADASSAWNKPRDGFLNLAPGGF
jgi:hypothetical protein